jgi:hypothetical protein
VRGTTAVKFARKSRDGLRKREECSGSNGFRGKI